MNAQQYIQKLLREKLAEYQLRNPAFSLRALANRLGTTPSTLSRLLNGKRKPSKKLATKIVDKFSLNPEDAKKLLASYPNRRSHLPAEASISPEANRITIDHFHVVADWYYFGVRALLRTTGAQSTPEWIADRLEISVTEARQAIDRLLRLQMLIRDDQGGLKATDSDYHSNDGVSDPQIRRNHAQHLDLARKSLDIDPVELRDFTNLTFALNTENIPLLRQAIRRFRDEISSLAESKSTNEVYKMSIQLFPVTRTHPKKERKQNDPT